MDDIDAQINHAHAGTVNHHRIVACLGRLAGLLAGSSLEARDRCRKGPWWPPAPRAWTPSRR